RLLKINASLVERLEKLNKSLKVNAIKLYPISISEIMGICRQRVKENFSDYPVSVSGLDGSKLILADTTFLTEALYNIIQNGIEATKENKRNDAIEIEIEYGRMWAEITISDRGKGIDKALKKHIWEPFHSSKNSSTNWGIGMYFTRLVIKRHFGSISFMARKDGGTSFVVMLPLAGRGNDQSNVGRRQ
ncbi:MAG: sensor histidine kinase, partial [Candidatus Ornithospirochaeta sp.]